MIINGVDCGWFGEKCNQGSGGRGAPPLKLNASGSASTGVGAKAGGSAKVTRPSPEPTSRFKGIDPQTFNKQIKQTSTNLGLPEWAIPAGIVAVVMMIIMFIIR